MPKKTPVQWRFVGSQEFSTKGEAERFKVEEGVRKKRAGYKTRYEVDLIPETGKFRVREFIYMSDEKGNLI